MITVGAPATTALQRIVNRRDGLLAGPAGMTDNPRLAKLLVLIFPLASYLESPELACTVLFFSQRGAPLLERAVTAMMNSREHTSVSTVLAS